MDTKHFITDSAVRLASQIGWANTSVRAIAKEIGYSTIKIYSDFGSKDELLTHIQNQGFGLLLQGYLQAEQQEADAEARMIRISEAHYQFARNNRVYYDLMFQLNGTNCSVKNHDILLQTSAPVRRVLQELHGQASWDVFRFWWALVHGYVLVSDSQTEEEGLHGLLFCVQRFITSIKA